MSTLLPPPHPAGAIPEAPHELVLAAAGAGKTFHLSSRIIALLAHGAPPEQVLASTFTRKAAGEILDRVLKRIALAARSEEEAAKLSEHASLEGGAPLRNDSAAWAELLRSVVRRLHRMNVGTLDAYFVGAARTFAHELELPPGWVIADETWIRRLRSEALQQVLSEAGEQEMVELLRLAQGGDVRRSVHDHILDDLDELLEIHEALDPGVPDPWGAFAAETPPLSPDDRARIADAIRRIEVPLTRQNAPKASWQKALGRAADAVEGGDWPGLLSSGICRKILEGEAAFDRVELSDDVLDAFREGLDLAAAALRPRLARQIRALGELTGRYAAALTGLQYRSGAYRFGDLTRRVGGPEPLLGRPDLYYRLDAAARHLLLDEFQDTSRAQWEALQPLFDEALQDDSRAAVVVADPKQSIYGWRGAEPRVVHALKERYTLDPRTLSHSWRSSEVILDFVNQVFQELPANTVLADDEGCRDAALEWVGDFTRHEANLALPGYVAVEVGPRDGGRGSQRPLLCRCAAQRVKEICDQAPGFSVGVLTRKNSGVARMILELRDLGVDASEEGGTPLTDSAAVEAVLALLRLADHPGDAIARYHVAHTPLGVHLGLTDRMDEAAVHRLSRRTRAELLRDGYGAVLNRWARAVDGSCSPRERRRMRQLVELAFRYEERATLRPMDFVRLVESERIQSPARSRVRVMTVHQAKGLEFDVVVLPELDDTLFRASRTPAIPWRDEAGGRITAVFPGASGQERCLFPELEAPYEQSRRAGLRDGLSGLYVALTRARYALHLVIRADDDRGKQGSSLSAARLVRAAVGAEGVAREGETLYESGDREWFRKPHATPEAVEGLAGADEAAPLTLRRSATRRRLLPRSSPSRLEGGARIDLSSILRLDTRASLDRGSVLHRWFEEIGWIEEGIPDAAALRRLAAEVAPGWPEAEILRALATFEAALTTPQLRTALSRARFPAGARVEREVPFVWRERDDDGVPRGLLEGVVDRLVIVPGADGRPARAEVLDFKTDSVAGNDALLRDRIAHYAPQIRAYCEAVAGMYGLPADAVEGRLLFVELGRVERPG